MYPLGGAVWRHIHLKARYTIFISYYITPYLYVLNLFRDFITRADSTFLSNINIDMCLQQMKNRSVIITALRLWKWKHDCFISLLMFLDKMQNQNLNVLQLHNNYTISAPCPHRRQFFSHYASRRLLTADTCFIHFLYRFFGFCNQVADFKAWLSAGSWLSVNRPTDLWLKVTILNDCICRATRHSLYFQTNLHRNVKTAKLKVL